MEKLCKCNLPAKRLEVKKEGPNKGRFFYGCAQEREKQCDFFEWERKPEVVNIVLPLQEKSSEITLQLDVIHQDLQRIIELLESEDKNLKDIPF